MNTRDIRTSHDVSVCDVCGRTLLRGERADIYLNGGTRRSVCELCKTRALHEGWVREGTVPNYDGGDSNGDRRRSLLGRRRRRAKDGQETNPTLADELDAHAWSEAEGIELGPVDELEPPLPPSPAPAEPPRRRRQRPTRERAPREREQPPVSRGPREPRHVRAVPSGLEQQMAAAADAFNGSEHRRTVSGVARSLGEPSVAILPLANRPGQVHIVVSWELCWYRYQIDLGDDTPTVRVDGQGYELSELTPPEQQPNATADEAGVLAIPGA